MKPFEGFPHVLEAQQFEPDTLESLFTVADAIRSSPDNFRGTLAGRKVALLFAQPSSRTRGSFQIAAEMLGAHVHVEEHMAAFSSVVKGESLEDTVRTFARYGMQYFIIRWNAEGSVARAAAVAGPTIPVINAGDGPGQHPTQALLDLYTIWQEFGAFTVPFPVCFVGDLANSRTVHSLVYLLAKYELVQFRFVSPQSARMKPGIIEHLGRHGRIFEEHFEDGMPLAEAAFRSNMLYVTRPQLEYQDSDAGRQQLVEQYQQFIVTSKVAHGMSQGSIILHPLPRNFELPEEVDANPRARYFDQVENGLWLRMALLERIENERINRLAVAASTTKP